MQLSATDEESIRAMAGEWKRSWNAHDMCALASLFTADADFVSVFASHWRGRDEIAAAHEARHARRFRASRWHNQTVTVAGLSNDVALAHVDWTRRGDHDPEDIPVGAVHGTFTWVLLRQQSGQWRIRAAQNTNALAPAVQVGAASAPKPKRSIG